MTKLTIYLYDSCCHDKTHIAAVVEEEKTAKKIVVEYGWNNLQQLKYPNKHSDVVLLYSDKNIDEFIKQYQKKFPNRNYGMFYNNCADAINYTLNYFFPNHYSQQCWLTTKKLLCCIPGILFFGGTCGPAPGFITTPNIVFTKAKSIEQAEQNKNQISNPRSQILMTP